MGSKQENYRHLADTLIKKFEARRIAACYVDSREEALEKVREMLTPGASIGVGGSVTLAESGVMDLIKSGDYDFIDRFSAKTPEEIRDVATRTAVADFFLMSTNAFTKDGELVNIDGRGNRLAYLLYGPEKVILVAGMNKFAVDVDSAVARVRNMASPPNCVRLQMKTPCAATGVCANCTSDDCICCHIVVTRFSRVPGRISLILVGEDLGY